jgi:predicted Fe-S protein YdhL (DUF1289 family)
MDPLESPCIGVCTIAPASDGPGAGLCRGCWRTIDEIARWRAMTKPERAAVLVACADRRSALDDARGARA